MLLFCPSCSNMLTIARVPLTEPGPNAGKNRFECRTCPYEMVLDRKYYERKTFTHKASNEGSDILGGAESWKNVDRTETRCTDEGCESKQAYFRQVQIRSADEPMTSFYKCVECGREWREN